MINIAIIGAGPYGLSIAACLRQNGVPFRIFGRPMDSWMSHMPKGMLLKSDGFASNLHDPNNELTLKRFCAERNIAYGDSGIPVRLDTFTNYGLAFRERMVGELSDKHLVSLEKVDGGFQLGFEDGETVQARRVVLAVGVTHFGQIPATLAHLPQGYVSHSFQHHDLDPLRGRSVIVVGAGSSASDLAGLLHQAGAQVQIVARPKELKFHGKPEIGRHRSLWQQLRHPKSGLGPGLRNRFFANWPHLFYYLPESVRLKFVRTILGPSGGWFARDMVVGKVPLVLGYAIERAEVQNGKAILHLRGKDGSRRDVSADHIIAATGYKPDMDRLAFLSSEIRSNLKTLDRAPVLSPSFESSEPGLYFAGVAAANSFGPLMRFAFGSRFAASTIARALVKASAKEALPLASRQMATTEAVNR
jgi:hypothetical protein